MKTLQDLFQIVAEAVESNQRRTHDFFIDYSGHVNKLSVRYYSTGWKVDNHSEGVEFTLDDEGIQGAYWFIKTKLS